MAAAMRKHGTEVEMHSKEFHIIRHNPKPWLSPSCLIQSSGRSLSHVDLCVLVEAIECNERIE